MRTLLLDRDGVINHDRADFIRRAADWKPIAGSLEALARAQQAGYRLVVISNQSGLGRGLFSMRDLNEIQTRLQSELEKFRARIDAFFFCPHQPNAACSCRKPSAGLLHSLAERLQLDLTDVPFVGDRQSDALAAQAVGARPILVRTGLRELVVDHPRLRGIEVYSNLSSAVDTLLEC